jgi:hypothetical protein
MNEGSYLLKEPTQSVTSEYTTGKQQSLPTEKTSSPSFIKLSNKRSKSSPIAGKPINIDIAVKQNPPPYHQNHIYTQPVKRSSSKGGGKQQQAMVCSNSLHHSFATGDSPKRNDPSFDDVQQELIKSLELVPHLKSHINAKITGMMENSVVNGRHRLRTTLVEFIRSVNGIESITNYDDYVAKYEDVKVRHNTVVISREQLSVDLYKYDEQYLYLSQILLYLSQLKPPLTAIIAKTELEVALKSIYQDDSTIYDDDIQSSTITATSETADLPELARLSPPQSLQSDGKTGGSSNGISKMMDQLFDYVSELSPIKVKKIVYHYTLTVDLALTTPVIVKSKKSSSTTNMQSVQYTHSNVF